MICRRVRSAQSQKTTLARQKSGGRNDLRERRFDLSVRDRESPNAGPYTPEGGDRPVTQPLGPLKLTGEDRQPNRNNEDAGAGDGDDQERHAHNEEAEPSYRDGDRAQPMSGRALRTSSDLHREHTVTTRSSITTPQFGHDSSAGR